jgi:hypothetical protein
MEASGTLKTSTSDRVTFQKRRHECRDAGFTLHVPRSPDIASLVFREINIKPLVKAIQHATKRVSSGMPIFVTRVTLQL